MCRGMSDAMVLTLRGVISHQVRRMTADDLVKVARHLAGAVASGAGISLLALSPMILVGWRLYRRKVDYKAEAIDPLTEMPMRPPGESLRIKLEELNEKFDNEMAVTFMITIGVAIYGGCLVTMGDSNPVVLVFLGVVAIVAAISAWRSLKTLQRQLFDHRLGFTGERVVGEWLHRLAADGFEIFHDMPFENFNIDHIIVGRPGVFAIETKTRRKPAELKGAAKATVIYDGAALNFPRGYRNVEWLEQAERNAKTLSKFLSSSTGEFTPVNAILALPGWWVERRARGSVKVLNPKEIQHSFSSKDGPPLSPQRIKQIAHQLTEKCRIEKAK
jgi:hypothetical protein